MLAPRQDCDPLICQNVRSRNLKRLLGFPTRIVAHNHPSGDVTPSQDDREVFDRLRRAGELLGIRLLDSLVFNEAGRWTRVEPILGKHG
jgi:hypothetical protein